MKVKMLAGMEQINENDACNQQNQINRNQEITAKVFKMMETFTQRILNIENQMEMKNH